VPADRQGAQKPLPGTAAYDNHSAMLAVSASERQACHENVMRL
jgi:hypothetical protein